MSIPLEAQQAAASGRVIEAIKLTRERTGLSLKEAKDLVDAFLSGAPPQSLSPAGAEVPADAISALWEGNLIEAIRRTRAHTGLGLKDAKELVERYLANSPGTQSRFREAAAERARGPLRVMKIAALAALVALGYLWAIGKVP